MSQTLWFASQNQQKIKEVKQILEPIGFQIKSLLDYLPDLDIVEDGATYIENALIKARTLAKLVQAPVIADDTGLEIACLDGFPGLHSSRWKQDLTFYQAMEVILAQMKNAKNRSAAMITAIAFVDPINKIEQTFISKLDGEITKTLEAEPGGFGYDQFFYVPQAQATFFRMGAAMKNQISHRALALQQLLAFLQNYQKN